MSLAWVKGRVWVFPEPVSSQVDWIHKVKFNELYTIKIRIIRCEEFELELCGQAKFLAAVCLRQWITVDRLYGRELEGELTSGIELL